MTDSRLHILHIIYGVFVGGCERLLSDVIRHSDQTAHRHSVIFLSDDNERIGLIKDKFHIPYFTVDMKHQPQQLLPLIRTCQPDIIHTWTPLANITAGPIGNVLDIPVIWSIHSAMSPEQFPDLRSTINRLLNLSRSVPKCIVCCSDPVHDLCIRLGFAPHLLVTINNGTDTELFTYSPRGRRRIRTNIAINTDTPLIGMAANYAMCKGHENFLYAAKLFLALHPNAHFLLCGGKIDDDNIPLTSIISNLDLQQRVHLLGFRDDMPDIYSAMDIHTLNSTNESFGLATTEAMSCKTLCVVTDVGISKTLLGNTGIIIPPAHQPDELAAAWQSLLSLTPEAKSSSSQAGREHIQKHYSVVTTAKKYDQLYKNYA